MLTAEIAREFFSYDPDSGELRWKASPAKRAKVGEIVGTRHRYTHATYIDFKFRGRTYKAHRVVWLLFYGVWPDGEIDHINSVGTDKRITNLRDVTPSENCKNKKLYKSNSSGFCGVHYRKESRKWLAFIKFNGKRISLGLFVDIEDAVAARAAASQKYEFHELHGTEKHL